MNLADLIGMAFLALRDPDGSARRIIALNVPLRTAWEVLAFVVVLSALATIGAEALGLAEPVMVYGEEQESFSFGLSMVNGLVLAVAALLIHSVGRAFGGTGELADSVMLMAFLQFILILLQVVQFLVFIVLPPLAGLFSILALLLLFWLPTNFTATLHGFRSRPAVFVGLVVAGVVMLFSVSSLLGMYGLELNMGVPSDI